MSWVVLGWLILLRLFAVVISVNVSANIQEERRFLSDCKDKTYFLFCNSGRECVVFWSNPTMWTHITWALGTGQRPNSSLNKDNSVTSRDDGALVLQRYDNILCMHFALWSWSKLPAETIYNLLFYSFILFLQGQAKSRAIWALFLSSVRRCILDWLGLDCSKYREFCYLWWQCWLFDPEF